MNKIKSQIVEFYKKDYSIQFSKNVWLDVLGHALIGMTIGATMSLLRSTNPMPSLLLSPTATALWGLRNHLKKNKQNRTDIKDNR